MASVARSVRRLLRLHEEGKYDETTGFGYSGMGVITNYMILIQGLLSALYVAHRTTTASYASASLVCTALAFGVSGVVHHRIGVAVEANTDSSGVTMRSKLLPCSAARRFPLDLLKPEAIYVRDWGIAVAFNLLGTYLEVLTVLHYSPWGSSYLVSGVLGNVQVLIALWAMVFYYAASSTNNVAFVFLFVGGSFSAFSVLAMFQGNVWWAVHGLLALFGFACAAFGPRCEGNDYDKDFAYHTLKMLDLVCFIKGLYDY